MVMDQQLKQMGKRLKELRTILEISPSELAALNGISEAEYLKHEEGEVDSSITFIYRCAERMGVDMSALVRGESPKLSIYNLTRHGQGMPIKRRAELEYMHLAPDLKHRYTEPLYVVAPLKPENSPIPLSTHSGQEFDYILKGTLKVMVNGKIEVMHEGDSILYDSSLPHGMIAIGDQPCEFLALVIHGAGELPESVMPKKVEVKKDIHDDLIYHKFMDEFTDSEGHLTGVKYHYPENFNFAYDVIDDLAARKPDQMALVYVDKHHNNRNFTFKDISRYSQITANYLVSLGVKRGDRIMLVLKRHYQWWWIMLAMHRIGAIAVPATSQLQVHDYQYRFERGEIKGIICTADDGVPDFVDEACKTSPNVKLKIIVNGTRPGYHDFNTEVMSGFSDVFPRQPGQKANDVQMMYFSSGTSGNPKMILHSFTYPLGHITTARWWQNVQPAKLHLSISDTGWGKAIWGKIYGQWLCETTLFVYDFDRFDASDIMGLLSQYKITTFCAPPTMYRFFIREDLSKYDLSSIQYAATAGEALNPEVFNIFLKATGHKIMEGFGQTETTCTVGNLIGTTPKPGSMGKPNPQYHIELLDPDGNPVENGKTGEVCIKAEPGEVPGLFLGYYNDDEENRESWHDGFYHTGDTAWRDEDGYFYYVGRKDDVIKSSGYRIGPFEVESVMMELPYVLECAVVGEPDEIRGQVVKAYIVLTKNTTPSEELKKEIQDYVKHHTAPYKYPRRIEFIAAMPKTNSGKIKRSDLRHYHDHDNDKK